jgi:glyoxylase-like metal-dependent hydrolase (beta-lactamase superfamily II)
VLPTADPPGSRVPRVLIAVAAAAVVAFGGRAVIAQQNIDFSKVNIDVIEVRPHVHMLVGAGGNTTIFDGPEGVMVVDTMYAPMAEKILAAIKSLTDAPIRYVVNTHVHPDHIGGNEIIAKAGRTRAGGNVVGDIGADATDQAAVLAHENVLNRLSMPAQGQPQVPFAAWPTETFANDRKEMIFNGEAVQIIHEPAAHTDGDSVVFFRHNDVLATGDLFTTTMYPFIDAANGGTMDGEVKALNAILDITIASNVNEGGTMVIPGHGRLCDEQDVIEYRDMATIIRDRIKEYVKRGLTLEQVKAKKPTLDFDPRYNTPNGFWDADKLVAEVYKEMSAAQPKAAPAPKGKSTGKSSKKGTAE